MLAQADLGAGLSVSAIVLFGLFIRTMVNTLRYAAGTLRHEAAARAGLITQATAYAAGMIGVFLFGASQLGHAVKVAGVDLAGANVPTKVILGLMVASLGGNFTDVIKGVDRSQSAAVPSLLRETAPVPVPVVVMGAPSVVVPPDA